MVPSRFQLPPTNAPGASATGIGGPPDTLRVFNFPSAKNPRLSPFGDQKGLAAPSVPATRCATGESKERTQSISFPLVSAAVKATVRPSGESAGGPGSTKLKWHFSGGGISEM